MACATLFRVNRLWDFTAGGYPIDAINASVSCSLVHPRRISGAHEWLARSRHELTSVETSRVASTDTASALATHPGMYSREHIAHEGTELDWSESSDLISGEIASPVAVPLRQNCNAKS